MKHAVRLADKDAGLIEGVGIPYGGPWVGADGQGRDLYGQFFSAKTELCLDWFPERPLLYQHGFDEGTRVDPVGRVKAWEVRSDGVWVQAQLDTSSDYFDAIRELIEKGRLFFSSGSVEHLFKAAKDGEILMWPWIELSLTPNPANLFAAIDQPSAEKHWQAAGFTVKALTDRVKALPTEPTPASSPNGYGPPPGSYESLIRTLDRAVAQLLCDPMAYDCCCYVVATFPGYVVACCCDDRGARYYEVSYELQIGDDGIGTPILGEARQVEMVYLPIDIPPDEMAPTAVMSSYTVRSATALAGRVRVLHEGRVKEGRVLSPTNRERLVKAHAELTGLVKTYADLLAETEPKTRAEVGATNAACVEVQAAYARILALASGLEVAP